MRKKKLTYPSDISGIPLGVSIPLLLEAQNVALKATKTLPETVARVELFWVTFNFEYRQQAERWLREHAKL